MFSSVTNFFRDLTTDPAGTIITLLYVTVCILFSLIIHECAHGWVALKCGDPTAQMMGRLTLDPRKHLDPLGTVCMLLLRVGWAKPVPINPRNFRNYRRDYILVSLAGIAANLLICLASLVLSALLSKGAWQPELLETLREQGNTDLLINVYKNRFAAAVYNGMFNYYPFAASTGLMYVLRLFLMLAQMNLGLAIFNLLPVPPLDGYRFLDQFVFKGRLAMNPQTMQMIHMIFMVICISGALSGLLSTVNSTVMGALCSVVRVII